ncbi:hypothetical protein F4802DRAFT_549354, partial [Xylaria palmicola]
MALSSSFLAFRLQLYVGWVGADAEPNSILLDYISKIGLSAIYLGSSWLSHRIWLWLSTASRNFGCLLPPGEACLPASLLHQTCPM